MEYLRRQSRQVIFGALLGFSGAYYLLYFTFEWFRQLADLGEVLHITWELVPIAIIYLYETSWWKRFNPSFDFDGYWDFTEEQYTWLGGSQKEKDHDAWGHMRIKQSPLAIRIVEGVTNVGATTDPPERLLRSTWWSGSCDLDNDACRIIAALEHKSSSARKGGAIQYGVEEIAVVDRDDRDRPIELSSTVYHCVGAGDPRIVHCRYKRRQRKPRPPGNRSGSRADALDHPKPPTQFRSTPQSPTADAPAEAASPAHRSSR